MLFDAPLPILIPPPPRGRGRDRNQENTIRVSVHRCLGREEESLKQLEDDVDASATAVTNMARAKAGGDPQRGEGGEKERLGGGKGLMEEWLRTHLTGALRRAEDGVKDVLVTLRALERYGRDGFFLEQFVGGYEKARR